MELIACTDDETIRVEKVEVEIGERLEFRYNIWSNGELRHPVCQPDDAVRALMNYIESYQHRERKRKQTGM